MEIHSAFVEMQQVGFLMDLKSPSDVFSRHRIGVESVLFFEIAVFQVMARCIVVISYQHFEGICC